MVAFSEPPNDSTWLENALAHITKQSRLSLGSYGRPRMTEEPKEAGVDVGHRRVGRLMRENGTIVERTGKIKATTDSDHKFNISPNLLERDFTADQPNQKWEGDAMVEIFRSCFVSQSRPHLGLAKNCHSDQNAPMSTMNISLPETLKAFVDDQVTEGGYSTSSEYVRELIRRDQDRQQLKGLLLQGAKSKKGAVADAAYFDGLRQKLKQRKKA